MAPLNGVIDVRLPDKSVGVLELAVTIAAGVSLPYCKVLLQRPPAESLECTLNRFKLGISKRYRKVLNMPSRKPRKNPGPDCSAAGKHSDLPSILDIEVPTDKFDMNTVDFWLNSRSLAGQLNFQSDDSSSAKVVLGAQNDASEGGSVDVTWSIYVNRPYAELKRSPFSRVYATWPSSIRIFSRYCKGCEFEWFVRNSGASCDGSDTKVSNGQVYIPRSCDIGKVLKVKVTPYIIDADVAVYGESIESDEWIVKCPPTDPQATEAVGALAARSVMLYQERKWDLDGGCSSNKDSIRVCSYNILADRYASTTFAKTKLYPYATQASLDSAFRSQAVISELLDVDEGYCAAIYMLQEVDQDLFSSYYEPMMNAYNYSGILRTKIKGSEGCALFYSSERFHVLDDFTCTVESLVETSMLYEWISKCPKLLAEVKEKGSVLQVCLLTDTKSTLPVLVANTHLYWHPKGDLVRLLQTAFILEYLERLSIRIATESGEKPRLLFGGDLNSQPESPAMQLVFGGQWNMDFVGIESASLFPAEPILPPSFTHKLQLQDACPGIVTSNHTGGFSARLDWIFHRKDDFHRVRSLLSPPEEALNANTALPSHLAPSDHLALVCDLAPLP